MTAAGAVLVAVKLLSAWAILAGIAHTSNAVDLTAVAGGVVILEDSPGWDCATMGNRVCGN